MNTEKWGVFKELTLDEKREALKHLTRIFVVQADELLKEGIFGASGRLTVHGDANGMDFDMSVVFAKKERGGRVFESGAKMSEKLKPCPFCGCEAHIKDIVDEKGLLMHEFVCAEGSSCLGSGLFTAFFPERKETAIEQWNSRAQLYTPVKIEEITEGFYWVCGSDGCFIHLVTLNGSVLVINYGERNEVSIRQLIDSGKKVFEIEYPIREVAE